MTIHVVGANMVLSSTCMALIHNINNPFAGSNGEASMRAASGELRN